MMLASLVCVLVCICNCFGQIDPTENYPHSVAFNQDETMMLFWKFDETYITFEIHGKTTGWVGIGISPSGGMGSADIMMGWVDSEGVGHISDRHGAEGNSFPPLDTEQNLDLIFSQEKDGWTVVKFQRQMAACENVFDLPITADTLRVIYAYGDSDPVDNELVPEDYHGPTKRGTKSLLIFDETKSDESEFPAGEKHESFELRNDDFAVPALPSYYNCRLFKLPEFKTKQHFVKGEILITEGNEFNVHHMIFYTCPTRNDNAQHVDTDVECFSSDMPPDFGNCFSVLIAWAIGAGDFYFPIEAGYPMGGESSDMYGVLETHYDNPELKADIVDSSGIRFIYTPDLRVHDSGFLQVGVAVSGFQHLVPPHAQSFLSRGDCVEGCLTAGMDGTGIDTLNVFSAVLHSHLQGRKMRVRHFRDGVELPFLVKDDAYDFNYQETRVMKEEIQIKNGDSLQMVCDYKTLDRDNMTVGGLDTTQEMCMAFIYYYPQINTVFCENSPNFTQVHRYFGIEDFELTNNASMFEFNFSIEDTVITAPENISGQSIYEYLNSMEWNEEAIQDYQAAIDKMDHANICLSGTTFLPGFGIYDPLISVDEPYVEPQLECITDVDTTTTPPVTTTSAASKIMPLSLQSLVVALGWLYALTA